jgi:fused signal recognition particle receptor
MGFFDKLKSGLFKTKSAIVGKIDGLLKKFRRVDEDFFDELEEILITADIGVNTTEEILDNLREYAIDNNVKESEQIRSELMRMLKEMIGAHEPLDLSTKPSVVLIVGVNGVGKTTSIGKIAKELKSQGKKVVVAAADTFRAAAAEQLSVWCDRAGVDIIKQAAGADPAGSSGPGMTERQRKAVRFRAHGF